VQPAATLAAGDAERLRIARTFGVAACSLQAWIGTVYGHHAGTLETTLRGNPAYVGIKAPNTLEHRYLLEDVPTGLVPLIELGSAAGLFLPVLERLLGLARSALGGEPWQGPRTLAALGLDGLGPRDIRAVVESEMAPARIASTPVAAPAFAAFSPGLGLVPQL
jgi:opine dehydrogenase